MYVKRKYLRLKSGTKFYPIHGRVVEAANPLPHQHVQALKNTSPLLHSSLQK
jgi:hypothetical protein